MRFRKQAAVEQAHRLQYQAVVARRAAFLVPRSRARSFQSLMAREAKSLGRHGYGVTLTGPWPPYSFVQD